MLFIQIEVEKKKNSNISEHIEKYLNRLQLISSFEDYFLINIKIIMLRIFRHILLVFFFVINEFRHQYGRYNWK